MPVACVPKRSQVRRGQVASVTVGSATYVGYMFDESVCQAVLS